MLKKQYTNEQIAFALRQAETGSPGVEICRKMGVAEPTFYRRKKKFSSMGVSEIRRLIQIERRKELPLPLSLRRLVLIVCLFA